MDPTQVNPQSLAILQALQGQGAAPDAGMANLAQQQAALGAQQGQPNVMGGSPNQSDMYNAMMQPPPMTPPPAPIY